jgi:hypothetical protein
VRNFALSETTKITANSHELQLSFLGCLALFEIPHGHDIADVALFVQPNIVAYLIGQQR